DPERGRPCVAVHPDQQQDAQQQRDEGREHVHRSLDHATAVAEPQYQGCSGQGKQDGGNNPELQIVGKQRNRVQGSSSCPSTWSPSLRPRKASSSTRNSAVVAKPMTIAVSTNAWGSGSAYCVRSAAS